jgi:hypothetical protein
MGPLAPGITRSSVNHLEQFRNRAERLRGLYTFVESPATSRDVAGCIERSLRHFGLRWPNCINSLESSLAIDLENPELSQAGSTD